MDTEDWDFPNPADDVLDEAEAEGVAGGPEYEAVGEVPFSFDQEGEQEVVEELVQQQPTVEPMSEVEKRFEKGRLYNTIIKGTIFGDPENEAQAEVEKEFKDFAIRMRDELIGIAKPKIDTSSFTDQEILILKVLAKSVAEKRGLGVVKPPKPKTEAPRPPVQRPLVTKPQPVVKPKPAVKPAVNLQPAVKPVAKPKPRLPSLPEAASAAPSTQPRLPNEGEKYRMKGQEFIAKYIQMDNVDALGEENAKKIRKLKNGQYHYFENLGMSILRRDESYIKVVGSPLKKEIQPGQDYVPMPDAGSFTALRATQAAIAGAKNLQRAGKAGVRI